jgi:tRNA nucleotidyltransferase/poly(A) polymerase
MRFKVRLGFEIESATHVLFNEACNQRLLERLDGFRLFDEYRKALCEQNPESVIEALHEADLLKYVLPVGLKWNPNTLSLSAITRSGKQALLRKRAYDYWKAVYTFICQTCSNDEFQQHIAGFGLSKEVRSELVSLHSYWRD